MRRLIVTADDFGVASEVNEAVMAAHRDGVLTAASLMVGAPAAAEAVALAKTAPRLGVGLHLVLVDGVPVLPPEQVPDLVDTRGCFRDDMVRAGMAFAFSPATRRQLEAEINAQFKAFAATGLQLDHVNAHKHFHVHPTVARIVLRIGARFGMASLRAPIEPRAVLTVAEASHDRRANGWTPLATLLRHRARRAGLLVPNAVFGLRWTGHVTATRLAALIEALPPGLNEIYMHPATTDDFAGHAAGADHRGEFAALCDARVRAAVATMTSGSFADFSPERIAT